MNDSKFIELLNLYVDHQISAEDAASLEAEIQHSPERRRIYRQYCQMQKACVLLAENFRAEAPEREQVRARAATRRRQIAQVGYVLGGLAAAACVAMVLVVNRQPDNLASPATATVAATETAPAIVPAMAEVPTAPVPLADRVALQPVFAGFESNTPSARLVISNSNQVPLDWMERVQLRKVTTEELWLEQRPSSQPEDLLFRSPRRFQGPAEMTAWRFQK